MNAFFPTAVWQRGVKVKFLVNDHASRVELMKEQLSTLQAKLFPNIEVRLFDVSIHSKVGIHGTIGIVDYSIYQ